MIDVEAFSQTLHASINSSPEPPDLIALAIQEIAPLSYAFLGGTYLTPYFSAYEDALSRRHGPKYDTVVSRNLGLTGIMLFARRDWTGRVKWLQTGGVGVGVRELGNKGAIGVRVGLVAGDERKAVVTFVAAHLTHGEEAVERRNEDWKSICRSLVFQADGVESPDTREGGDTEPLLSNTSTDNDEREVEEAKEGTLFNPPSHLFFLGDLNYRTSSRAPSTSHAQTWPQPTDSLEDQRHYRHLLSQDQLTRERKAHRTFHHLSEPPIAFPPTYKYSTAALEQARARLHARNDTPNDKDKLWLWAQHRWPSWCDRILYLDDIRPKIHFYDALTIQPTSDHRPVALSCSIDLHANKAGKSVVKNPFTIRSDWQAALATARRLEWVVGLAVYLGYTWEGETLVAGSVVGILGGYWLLSSLLL